MYVKRLGADMRNHRARQTLARMSRLQGAYLDSDSISLETTHAVRGPQAWRIRIKDDPPAELSELAALALRNARGALDELAAALVVASGRSSRHTVFPIAGSAHDFDEEQSTCLRHAHQSCRDAVRSVTPWKGADDRLWELHRLTRDTPNTLKLALGQVAPRSSSPLPHALRVLQTARPTSRAAAPLRDNSLLLPAASSTDASDPSRLIASQIQVVIGEGVLLSGQPAVHAVDVLITHVELVVNRVIEVVA